MVSDHERQRFRLTGDRNEHLFHAHVFDIMQGCSAYSTKAIEPRVAVLAGQPGAGKSSFIPTLDLGPTHAVQISTDQFRVVHDLWDEALRLHEEEAADLTNPDARIWLDKAIYHLIRRQRNVLVDATLSDTSYAENLLGDLNKFGCPIDVYFVATSRALSLWSNVARYYVLSLQGTRKARTCRRDNYDEVCDGVIRTAELVDSKAIPVNSVTVLCRRTQTSIYYNERTPPGDWEEPLFDGAAGALRKEQERTWTAEESHEFVGNYERLCRDMEGFDSKWDVWFQDIKQRASSRLAPGMSFHDATAALKSRPPIGGFGGD